MSQLLSCEFNYTLVGDYYIPNIALPEENRPIGKWGRMHREYLKEHHPILFNDLALSGQLWTYLADLNEQAQERLSLIIEQMKASEGVTEVIVRPIRERLHQKQKHQTQQRQNGKKNRDSWER